MLALIIGMWIGGCAGSTAGGVKCLRMGIFFSDFWQNIRQIGLPTTAVFQHKLRHIQDIVINDRMIRSAVLIFLSFTLSLPFGFVLLLCAYLLGLYGCYVLTFWVCMDVLSLSFGSVWVWQDY